MAINKNHEFEELDGVKCAIVEKNVSKERADFLKQLLAFNKYTVVVVAAAPPKPAPAAKAAAPAATESTEAASPAAANATEPAPPPPPTQFTIGVTDVTFNPINAIFGRLLKTPNGRIVTLAYWQQKEQISNDEIPYFARK